MFSAACQKQLLFDKFSWGNIIVEIYPDKINTFLQAGSVYLAINKLFAD